MKELKKILILFVIFIFIICCQNKKNKNSVLNEKFEIIYEPRFTMLGKYYPKNKNIEFYKNINNQFQYDIENNGDYFIIRDDENRIFNLVSFKNNVEELVYKFNDGENAYQVSQLNDKLYFIHLYFDKEGKEFEEKRKIGVLDLKTKKIQDFLNANGLIVYSNIDDDWLYYATYNKNEKYDIYRLNIKKDDLNIKPELVKENVNINGIVAENGNIFVWDRDFIYNIFDENKKWKSGNTNYLKNNKLIQLSTENSSIQNLKIIDILNNKTVFEKNNVFGLRWKEKSLKIYSESGVDEYNF